MKKIFSRLLFVLIGVIAFSTQVRAQMPTDPLPLDPQVRKGVLPNGLTYYIRHNETPKGQADFYIAQKVGSILENDEQRGLAHFLEHMCFNGTENFPGNELVTWLETKGVKFGQNLNAYTSIDETVYNISNVPTASIAVQDSCLLILHDWADGLLLLPEEIDKERGVIHEEWRSRNVGQQRLMEQMAPAMYPGSKYGYRLPIGTMEVVDNFAPQVLRDYYEAWYRPDQQGIVVVGDIDVDRIENKIKELFSPIKMPENAPERVYHSHRHRPRDAQLACHHILQERCASPRAPRHHGILAPGLYLRYAHRHAQQPSWGNLIDSRFPLRRRRFLLWQLFPL